MPLQVVSHALQLPAPVVRAAEPNWLFAETINLFDASLLLVYRSVALKDTDPIYADVKALLDRHTAEVIYDPERGTVRDPNMMFGHGQWAVYLLHEGAPREITDPRAREVVDMIKNWGAPTHPSLVADEIALRLSPVEEVA